MKRQRLTGGKKRFREAIDEAFAARIHNPSIRYSHREGFYVISDHYKLDPDEIYSQPVNYVCDAVGEWERNIRVSDYEAVRRQILAEGQ